MPRPFSEPPPRVVHAAFSAAANEGAHLPPPVGVEIAFAGRSNVGKSSLLNAMLDRKNLVRTSSTPGCTRGINFFAAKLADGAELTFVDLPGYGYAKRSKSERSQWGPLIEDYLLTRPTLRAVVLLVDVRRGLEPDDLEVIEAVESEPEVSRPPIRTIVVATKLDRVSTSARKPALAKLARSAGRQVLGFSTKDRKSRDELWAAIHRAVLR